jgi:phospholipase C
VCSQTFDHTSVGLFLEKRFGLKLSTVSPWHRAVCGDLSSALDFESPNDPVFPALPDQSNWAAIEAQQRMLPTPLPPATPQPLFQETGVRYSRALPYELSVSSRIDSDPRRGAAQLRVSFANSGRMGAVFHVYDRLDLQRIPRRYTVEAHKELSDAWSPAADGSYDLWILGPNGFHRHLAGNVRRVGATLPNPEIDVSYGIEAGELHVTLMNRGEVPCTFTVTANAYRNGPARTVTVVARTQTKLNLPIGHSACWYDFSVTVNGLTGFLRRFAGRMETGRPSVSDPAMGTAA